MKRFYSEVAIAEESDGWTVRLDGRAIRTQGGQPQRVPNSALAELLAAEWRDQGETLDPRRFVHRDLADYAIDVIAPDPESVREGLLAYIETDTLFTAPIPTSISGAASSRCGNRWSPNSKRANRWCSSGSAA